MDELQELIKKILNAIGDLDIEDAVELTDFLASHGDLKGLEGLGMTLSHVLEWISEEA